MRRGSMTTGKRVRVDSRQVENMFDRLKGSGRVGKHNLKMACKVSLEVIRDETKKEASDIDWKTTPNRKKSFRKSIMQNGSYKFERVKDRKNKFWFREKVNYKKPANRVAHLVERGWNHVSGKFVTGRWFRKTAFENKREKAMEVLLNALNQGLAYTADGKKAGIKQFRKDVA